jgi:nicotinamide-nucleotide amidase
MFDRELIHKAEALVSSYRERGYRIATAESCTGGLLAGLITSIAGSSTVLDRGFVTYSNEAKAECLGVPQDMLDRYGAVSEQVARAMASGALTHSRAQVSIAITGIAGPGGGSREKPVGLVHFACARKDAIVAVEKRFGDIGRTEVRLASVEVAIGLLLEVLR